MLLRDLAARDQVQLREELRAWAPCRSIGRFARFKPFGKHNAFGCPCPQGRRLPALAVLVGEIEIMRSLSPQIACVRHRRLQGKASC
jgi:hypothetical protein